MHRDKLIAGVRGADNLYRRRGRDVESRCQIARLPASLSSVTVAGARLCRQISAISLIQSKRVDSFLKPILLDYNAIQRDC